MLTGIFLDALEVKGQSSGQNKAVSYNLSSQSPITGFNHLSTDLGNIREKQSFSYPATPSHTVNIR